MKIFFLSFLTVISLIVCALGLMVERTPIVLETPKLAPAIAASTRSLASKAIKNMIGPSKPFQLVVTDEQINGLIALGSQAIPRVSGRVNMTKWGALGAFTIRLKNTPFAAYLNISVQINPSSSGLEIDHVKIGDVTISGKISHALLQAILNFVLGDNQGTALLDAVKAVALTSQEAVVDILPPPNTLQRLENLRSRFKNYRDEITLYGDPMKVRTYYQKLVNLGLSYGDSADISLTAYLQPILLEAKQRSLLSSPEVENQAAILALAIYLGTRRFELLIGPVLTESMKKFKPPRKVVLAGRKDLRLHFIYSAALKIFSDQNASFSVGEFKELLDAGSNGSGFSFADLAADRAGIRFASFATDGKSGANLLLEQVSGDFTEPSFFPDITDLPEEISKEQFEKEYNNVNSLEYRKMVMLIDQRLEQLRVYRSAKAEN